MNLSQQKCIPCEGGVAPMSEEGISKNLALVPTWSLKDGKVFKKFEFADFKEAMVFVNAVAAIAEGEGHHPDIMISYNKVEITLFTHAIQGLSINDFIVASKIDLI